MTCSRLLCTAPAHPALPREPRGEGFGWAFAIRPQSPAARAYYSSPQHSLPCGTLAPGSLCFLLPFPHLQQLQFKTSRVPMTPPGPAAPAPMPLSPSLGWSPELTARVSRGGRPRVGHRKRAAPVAAIASPKDRSPPRTRCAEVERAQASFSRLSDAPASVPRGFSSGRGWSSRQVQKTPIGHSLLFFLCLHGFKNSTGGNFLSPPPFHLY